MPWRNTLIQQIPVPDLSHTGIKTQFTIGPTGSAPVDFLRPDGRISNALRRTIQQEIKNLPSGGYNDVLDMSYRDKEKRRIRADTLSKMKSPTKKKNIVKGKVRRESNLDAFQLNDLQSSSIRSIVKQAVSDSIMELGPVKVGVADVHKKKPFSASSLFNALLDSQCGGDDGEKWEMEEYAMLDDQFFEVDVGEESEEEEEEWGDEEEEEQREEEEPSTEEGLIEC